MSYKEGLFIGVDVGTGSARVALVNEVGKILKVSTTTIKTWKPANDYFEQSSDDIWNACVTGIKDVLVSIPPNKIKGIGFDATCSLVALSSNFQPLTVSPTGKNEQNIILWMDHRAKQEAEFINNTNHPVLKYVGGKVSLEMEIPKLLWMKKNLPETWKNAGYFFDLPDFLTWKATGSNSRSLCSVVCKWNYEADNTGLQSWNEEYLTKIGLNDLMENGCLKIGSQVLPPGALCGKGLSDKAGTELGLLSGTPVATSIIDAHAGGLGMIGCSAPNVSFDFGSRLSLICGTSTCHMAVSESSIFVPGVWGPYYSAMVPGLWLNEAGQSASGILVDHIIDSHPAAQSIKDKCFGGRHIQDYLNELIKNMTSKQNLTHSCFLTKNLHLWPDFHGNRSPIADPALLGMISGLTLFSDEESLALKYLATLQALAYGTKHIMDSMMNSGYKKFESILICGGLSKNNLFVQIQSDVVGLPVLLPEETESVLLGAAILGARAANFFPDIATAVKSMGGKASVLCPNDEIYKYHLCKYQVFLKMLADQRSYETLMKNC